MLLLSVLLLGPDLVFLDTLRLEAWLCIMCHIAGAMRTWGEAWIERLVRAPGL